MRRNERLREMLVEARRWINNPDCPDWIRETPRSEREYRDAILKQIDDILKEPICRCHHDYDYECKMGCPDCGHNEGSLPYCEGKWERHK